MNGKNMWLGIAVLLVGAVGGAHARLRRFLSEARLPFSIDAN